MNTSPNPSALLTSKQELHIQFDQLSITMPPIKQATVSTTLPPCTVSNCPLNEVGIAHSEGIYKHDGKDQGGFCIMFANSNPPKFIWEAWQRFGDLERAIRKEKANGQDIQDLEKERAENSDLVDRFLDNHCSCNRCLDGEKH